MYRRRMLSTLALATTLGTSAALPASACDSCGCGYGYYGAGPGWGYSSAYYVAPAYNPAPVVAFVPAPRVYVATPVVSGYYAPAYGYGYYRSAGYGWRGRWGW